MTSRVEATGGAFVNLRACPIADWISKSVKAPFGLSTSKNTLFRGSFDGAVFPSNGRMALISLELKPWSLIIRAGVNTL